MENKYIGSWSTSNGSSYGGGYKFTNKRSAVETMREIARGNTPAGSVGRWLVTDIENGEKVALGKV
jgi:hypothetical protein